MQHPSFCTMYYVSPKAAAKLVRSTIPFLKNVQRDKLKENKRRFMVIIPMNGLTDRIGVILSWKVIADKLNKDFYKSGSRKSSVIEKEYLYLGIISDQVSRI